MDDSEHIYTLSQILSRCGAPEMQKERHACRSQIQEVTGGDKVKIWRRKDLTGTWLLNSSWMWMPQW